MSSAWVTLFLARPAEERNPVNTTTTSTFPTTSSFPTNGTWLSRWHQLYTAVPATPERVDAPVTVLPTRFTTAA